MKTNTTVAPSDADVRERAYYLWLENGCPSHRDQEMWFAAKVLLHDQVNLHRQRLRETLEGRQEDEQVRLHETPAARDARPGVAQSGAPQRQRSRAAKN
jgi:Protein of unknown function (DUF2934)